MYEACIRFWNTGLRDDLGQLSYWNLILKLGHSVIHRSIRQGSYSHFNTFLNTWDSVVSKTDGP